MNDKYVLKYAKEYKKKTNISPLTTHPGVYATIGFIKWLEAKCQDLKEEVKDLKKEKKKKKE